MRSYVSKDDPGIAKGSEGDPALLSATLEVFFTDTPSMRPDIHCGARP